MTTNTEAQEAQPAPVINTQQQINTMNSLAWTLKASHPQRALDLSEEAYKLATTGQFNPHCYKKGVMQSLRNLGWVNLHLSNHNLAKSYLHQALPLAEELEAKQELCQCHQLLAEIYKQTGHFENALAHYEHFYTLKQELLNKEVATKLNHLEVIHRTEAARKEAEIYQLKNVELEQEIAERKRIEAAVLQSNKDLEAGSRQLLALNRIIQTVASTLDFQTALNYVTEELVKLFDADTCGVALLNPEQTELTVVAEYAMTPNTPNAVGLVMPLADNPFLIQIIKTRKPDFLCRSDINPVTTGPQNFTKMRQIQCMMALPLLARGTVIGTIGIGISQTDRIFTPSEMRLAETVAGHVAGAIENARLFAEEQRQRHLAESLRQVATVLNSSLDRDTVLTKIMEQLGRVIQYDGASVFLQDDRDLVLARGTDFANMYIGYRVPLSGKDPTVRVLKSKAAGIIADVHQDPHWDIWPEGEKIRSWMGAPLLTDNIAIGVLTADNFKVGAYGQPEARILQIFANQAATAINNARLFEDLAVALEQTETLYAASLAMSVTLDLQRIFKVILSELKLVVPYDSASVQELKNNHLELIGIGTRQQI